MIKSKHFISLFFALTIIAVIFISGCVEQTLPAAQDAAKTGGAGTLGSNVKTENLNPIVWTEGQPGAAGLGVEGTVHYKCALTKGTLPEWLTLDGCTLTGTPPLLTGGTTESISPPFTIRVEDSANPPNKVDITTSVKVKKQKLILTLKTATCAQNQKCAASLVSDITGGTPPYHYYADSFMEGTPPLGTTINTNGELTGTPTTTGTYTFGVCAADVTGMSVCEQTTATVGSSSGEMHFSAPFNTRGVFGKAEATCDYEYGFNGKVDLSLTINENGLDVSGTATVSGTCTPMPKTNGRPSCSSASSMSSMASTTTFTGKSNLLWNFATSFTADGHVFNAKFSLGIGDDGTGSYDTTTYGSVVITSPGYEGGAYQDLIMNKV